MATRDVFGLWGADPFGEIRRLQDEVNRLFASTRVGAPQGFPAVNVYAHEDGIALTAEMPGVKAEDLDISVFRETLTLRGRREERPTDAKGYHRRERGQGEFARSVTLPFRVDPERVEANLQNGVLRLSLHRPEEDKPRKITVKA
jgi:HSP20 family protein